MNLQIISAQHITMSTTSEAMASDLFTKNLGGALFHRFMRVFCSIDKYYKEWMAMLHVETDGVDNKAGKSDEGENLARQTGVPSG